MADSKIKNENFYVVQGFMVNELKLKGLEKDIYAIIYGFSQTDSQRFTGSLQYLADWTKCSKQGVLKALKSLEEKGLIGREEKNIKGVKFVEYYSTEFNGGIKLSLTGGIKLSLTNNKELDNKEIDNIKYIVAFLNTRIGSNYKYTTPKTQSLIRARLKEGFTLEDFEKVICKMTRKWKGTEWEQYLRPETLFGTKFEGYLNENMEKRERYNTRGFDNIKNIEI